MTWSILPGDCLERLADLDDDSIDAVVTDPPYGLEFMGKDWDRPWAVSAENGVGYEGREDLRLPSHRDNRNANCRKCGGRQRGSKRCRCDKPQWDRDPAEDMRAFQFWTEAWATELLRVLKPGGHLLAFGGTRTYHRLASGIEDAGFEIRDCLAWHYGSGFPKSLDVSKAMDKAAGAEREKVPASGGLHNNRNLNDDGWHKVGALDPQMDSHLPATDLARQWQGWGTALKPAFEPIILARKPLIGTVAENVTRYGTGALNVDGCRVGFASEADRQESTAKNQHEDFGTPPLTGNTTYGDYSMVKPKNYNPPARWPANLVLDDQAAAMLDEQSGELPAQKTRSDPQDYSGNSAIFGVTKRGREYFGDTGGASRFFYQAKASRAERNAGLDEFEERMPDNAVDRGTQREGLEGAKGRGSLSLPRANHHPTVKPIDLMRWLVRLVTPPGGTVLDPFTGSGTTGIAAGLEGFEFVGIEREAEYREIAEARLRWWAEQEGETAEILQRAGLAEKERAKAEAAGQKSLFEEAA